VLSQLNIGRILQCIKFHAVLALIFFSIVSCEKETKSANDNPVPSVPVNISIYPNDPSYFNVQAIGGWMYIPGGINGIVLYRKSQEEFMAIERTSSYLPDNPKAAVLVQKDNFTLRDTISGSEWRMLDVIVMKTPAQWPLRLYGTSYNGNTLVIRN
jgi:hypothetical protein